MKKELTEQHIKIRFQKIPRDKHGSLKYDQHHSVSKACISHGLQPPLLRPGHSSMMRWKRLSPRRGLKCPNRGCYGLGSPSPRWENPRLSSPAPPPAAPVQDSPCRRCWCCSPLRTSCRFPGQPKEYGIRLAFGPRQKVST